MFRTSTLAATVLALTALVIGCGETTKITKNETKKTAEKKADDHSGWWCQEHGIPEEMCSLCLPEAKVKEMFKDKNDWCKIHDRAQSQCFKCDPSKYKKFEDMYVAKYDKKPERPPEEEFKK